MVPLLVGIAGGTGSGKTAVATRIVERLPPSQGVLVQQDSYYRDRSRLEPAARARINFDEPAAIDNDLLVRDLQDLKAGRAALCPQYDFSTHTRLAEPRRIEPHPVVVVEGILLFAVPALCQVFDLRLFVETDDDVRLIRRIKRDLGERGRDIASIEAQYLGSVRPMHQLYVEPSRHHAHLLIPEGGENAPALDVIVGRLLHLLAQGG